MRNALFAGTTIFGLIKELNHEVKDFIKEEVQLAKIELTEKLKKAGRNSIGLAIGGVLAFVGSIVLLLGLGGLLGFAFQKLGMQPLLAAALGVAVFGLIVTAIGAVLALKGVKALSKESLAPERTLKTLQAFKGVETHAKPKVQEEPKDKRTPQQIEKSILATETKLDNTLHELSNRLTFRHAKDTARGQIQSHPYKWGGAALGAGVLTSFLIKHKLQHNGG
jgi:Putative Actinobacterial Holin-X, holin superfamily III